MAEVREAPRHQHHYNFHSEQVAEAKAGEAGYPGQGEAEEGLGNLLSAPRLKHSLCYAVVSS